MTDLPDTAHALIALATREERRSKLTTADCARVLGMSTDFIRGEVRDGRLRATIFKPHGRIRAKYVIDAADFEEYQREHWKTAG